MSFVHHVGIRLASFGVDLVYLALLVVLIPWLLYLVVFKRRGVGSLRERLGGVSLPDASRPRIWIHAVSVGELEAALPLLGAFAKRAPHFEVVISTTTTTGLRVARKKCPEHTSFLYPLDLGFCVRRSLQRVDPVLIVLMELELWPNLILNAGARGIPLVVANGRVSRRGFDRMRRFRIFLRPFLRRVPRYLVQSREYGARLEELGVSSDRIYVSGNLKLDRPPLEGGARLRAEFEKSWGYAAGAPRWIAGSTHPQEEQKVLEAHAYLRERFENLSLILAPRHVERAPEILRLVKGAGFSVALFSEGPARGGAAPEILLVDVVGELSTLYACADLAFVGGSLVPRGGHNILEPALAGTPVIHGPYTANFRVPVDLLTGGGAAREVNSETLREEAEGLLRDPDLRRRRAELGLELLDAHRGVAENTLREIVSMTGDR